jgi:hypothetical protein
MEDSTKLSENKIFERLYTEEVKIFHSLANNPREKATFEWRYAGKSPSQFKDWMRYMTNILLKKPNVQFSRDSLNFIYINKDPSSNQAYWINTPIHLNIGESSIGLHSPLWPTTKNLDGLLKKGCSAKGIALIYDYSGRGEGYLSMKINFLDTKRIIWPFYISHHKKQIKDFFGLLMHLKDLRESDVERNQLAYEIDQERREINNEEVKERLQVKF